MLLTIKQTCERLAISRSQLWCLIKAGRIRKVEIGKRRFRIPEAEVERFIREGLEDAR